MSALPLSLAIQTAIEQRIAFLSDQSLNLSGDPYGSDSRPRVQVQHWIAYQGSDYPAVAAAADPFAQFTQERELEFQHYVEVQDLRRDFARALALHEVLLGAIAGFRPDVPGVLSPLRAANDGVVSAKVEAEVVYRYRATYRVRCAWVPKLPDAQADDPFSANRLEGVLWRSPIDQAGVPTPVATKVADLIVEVE